MPKPAGRENISQMARALGKGRNTIKKFLRQPGAPKPNGFGLYDRAAVGAFIELNRNGAGPVPMRDVPLINPHMAARVEKTKMEIEMRALDLAERRRDLISMAEVSGTLIALRNELDRIIYEELELTLPAAVQGKNVHQVRTLCQGIRDRVIGRFRSGSLNLQESPGG